MVEERVLVMAPAADVDLCRCLLAPSVAAVEPCEDLPHLCRLLQVAAGAVVLGEAALAAPGIDALLAILDRQPAWSEVPILVLAGGDTSDAGETPFPLERLGNVCWIERPLRASTLRTALRTALHSRRRQYQIRAHLQERDAAERALREGEERLRFSLEAGRLGSWQHDLLSDELTCSDLLWAHFGRSPETPLTHDDLLAAVHPEDRERAQETIGQAIRMGEAYVLEYRVVWPDGSLHWVMVRGRASYDDAGQPVSTFGVTLDITERKAAEARQAEVEEHLRQAARSKDEFLAMLAHELRNPLSPLASAIEIMRTRPGWEQGERALKMAERQLRHLRCLVDDLLDVSRITSGKITLKKQRVDLVSAVEDAVEAVRGFIDESGHALEVALPPASVYVDVDPVRLEQVVTNLLNNAAKYTEHGGRIWVAVEAARESVRIRVRDSGIGIPPELIGRVFELFIQGERGLDRSQGGLGLGLTLVRNLVHLHGGTVEAFSEGYGRGSEFLVTLPAASGPAPPLPGGSPAPAPADRNRTGQASRKLLVVDDNRDSAETLAELARIWGYDVAVAFDGLAALERAGEWEPGLLFLDIGMPGLDGYEVARRLRQDHRFARVTLVALTGYGREEDIARSRAAGFDHHLVKPVDVEELERLLRGGTV